MRTTFTTPRPLTLLRPQGRMTLTGGPTSGSLGPIGIALLAPVTFRHPLALAGPMGPVRHARLVTFGAFAAGVAYTRKFTLFGPFRGMVVASVLALRSVAGSDGEAFQAAVAGARHGAFRGPGGVVSVADVFALRALFDEGVAFFAAAAVFVEAPVGPRRQALVTDFGAISSQFTGSGFVTAAIRDFIGGSVGSRLVAARGVTLGTTIAPPRPFALCRKLRLMHQTPGITNRTLLLRRRRILRILLR